MPNHHAFQQIQLFRQGITFAFGEHQLTVIFHGAQTTAHSFLSCFIRDAQRNKNFFFRHGRIMRADNLQNKLPTGNGVVVFG